MTAPRSLDEVLADLISLQDELSATLDDDFNARVTLADRRVALRQEASRARARSSLPDGLTVEWIRQQIAHLESQILGHLNSRPSASAGGPSGGPGGGGIDPNRLHDLHRQMARAFGLNEKRIQLQQLKVRLAALQGE